MPTSTAARGRRVARTSRRGQGTDAATSTSLSMKRRRRGGDAKFFSRGHPGEGAHVWMRARCGRINAASRQTAMSSLSQSSIFMNPDAQAVIAWAVAIELKSCTRITARAYA